MVLIRRRLLLTVAVFGLACGPGRVGDDEVAGSTDSDSPTETGASTSESETTESEPTESETTESDTTESETTESETSAGAICGDGIVDPGEACDLGSDNAWELAACQPDCTLNECGDAFLGLDECSWPYCLDDCPNPPIFCEDELYSCGDGLDNDDDGLTDLHDPECLSPCDDDEGDFLTNLPGEGWNDCDRECFFDANGGSGDDECAWNLACDPPSPGDWAGCPYDPDLAMQQNVCSGTQSEQCLDSCLPLVPNGCDCFGCCELAGEFRLLEAAGCNMQNLDACPSCTPVWSCFNVCESVDACELCLLGELHFPCAGPTCPEGISPCTNPYECGEGEFCQAGCCRPIVPSFP